MPRQPVTEVDTVVAGGWRGETSVSPHANVDRPTLAWLISSSQPKPDVLEIWGLLPDVPSPLRCR
jgi:hypothetical protein